MSDNVLSFGAKKDELIEQRRRGFERLVFQNFLGAFSTIDEEGTIYQVQMVDISHDGCQFQIPWTQKKTCKYKMDDIVPLRLYFSKDSYIPVNVTIRHTQEVIESGGTYISFGCAFDKTHSSFVALATFIDFLYKYAEHGVIDRGDVRSMFI